MMEMYVGITHAECIDIGQQQKLKALSIWYICVSDLIHVEAAVRYHDEVVFMSFRNKVILYR